MLPPGRKRSVLAILQAVPRACGWRRTRWSCAAIAPGLQARRGTEVSGETVRRWLRESGREWKRAKLAAKGDDPERVEKLARIRSACGQVRAGVASFFADGSDTSLLPKVG
jgi:transposase